MKKSISIQTKKGARKTACTRLSSKAGARPSNTPCPTNCAIQQLTCTTVAHLLAVEPYVEVRWFAKAVPPIRRGASIPPATGSMSTYKIEYRNAAMVPRLGARFLTTRLSGSGINDGVFVP